MKTIILLLGILLSSITLCNAETVWIHPPVTQTTPTVVINQTPIIVAPAPRPPVKTIEWILSPQVSNVYVTEIRTGIFGRQYIVQKPQLITEWVWVGVETWK